MSDFATGLGASQLNPPDMVSFCQGLARRVNERLAEIDESGEARPDGIDTMLTSMADNLEPAVKAVKAHGYAINSELEDYTPDHLDAESPESRLAASALELARRVSGVPSSGWDGQTDLLNLLRSSCSTVAQQLRTIGD